MPYSYRDFHLQRKIIVLLYTFYFPFYMSKTSISHYSTKKNRNQNVSKLENKNYTIKQKTCTVYTISRQAPLDTNWCLHATPPWCSCILPVWQTARDWQIGKKWITFHWNPLELVTNSLCGTLYHCNTTMSYFLFPLFKSENSFTN